MDFLAFRNLLTPSSGFQSKQFRLIEAKLGLTMAQRHQFDYYKRTNDGGFIQNDYQEISHAEEGENLQQLINRWLERMPFFDATIWEGYNLVHTADKMPDMPFWNDYQSIYQQSLTPREINKINDFEYVFFERGAEGYSAEQQQTLKSNFSSKALRAALFIMLYRDFPVFQSSYQILDALIEIDLLLSNWRYKHLMMVRRMIGLRVGTGNTSGAGYLEGALSKHYIYKDIAGLSTYLVERARLPKLPEKLVQHLSFNAW
jgi:tryptophan 2,3-dioxygenase